MNNENLAYLQDNMKYLGFGEKLQLNTQLEEQLEKQPKEFQLKADAKFGEGNLEATLYFRKSDQTDLYFFNKYDAKLKNDQDSSAERSQTFYISKGSGVTLKEAFNLLEGRAVNKDLTNAEGQKYNAWIQLNFNEKDLYDNFKIKRYTTNYGFDLEKQLAKLLVLEAGTNHPKYAEVVRSLKKGNLVQVTSLDKEARFITANPPKGRIDLFDSQNNLLEAKREQGLTEKESNGQKKTESLEHGNGETVESIQKNKTSKTHTKKMGTDDDLEDASQSRKRGRGR